MKNVKLLRLLPAVTLLVFALSWSHALVAQQGRDAATPTAQGQQLPGTTNQRQTGTVAQLSNAKTFSGTIMKSGNQLVLQDGIGESMYQLNDQVRAKIFDGKNVRVTGTVDEVTNTITVTDLKSER